MEFASTRWRRDRRTRRGSWKKRLRRRAGNVGLQRSRSVALPMALVFALFVFSWKGLFLAAFLWWVSGSLGIGMGYHRLLTHRGYKTPKWVEYCLTVCATLALQGGPIGWVAFRAARAMLMFSAEGPRSIVEATK